MAPHPDGTFSDYSSPGGGSPALRKQLGILKRFLEGFDFLSMAPDNNVVLSVDPELTAYALVEPGEQYAVYLHAPLPNKPRRITDHVMENVTANLRLDLPEGEYAIEWHDTKSGQVIRRERIDHAGDGCSLQSPTFTNDVALRIVKN